MRRLDCALLSAVGVVLAHQIAYSIARFIGDSPSVAHGHMGIAWLLGSSAALIALALGVTKSLASRRHSPASFGALTLSISLGYLAMEFVEHLADGADIGGFLTEPVILIGLATSPLVAAALRWAVDATEALVLSLLSGPASQWLSKTVPPSLWGRGESEPIRVPVYVQSRRGPPRR